MYRLILFGGEVVSEDEDETGEPLPYRYVDSPSLEVLEEIAACLVLPPGRRMAIVNHYATAIAVQGRESEFIDWKKWGDE